MSDERLPEPVEWPKATNAFEELYDSEIIESKLVITCAACGYTGEEWVYWEMYPVMGATDCPECGVLVVINKAEPLAES